MLCYCIKLVGSIQSIITLCVPYRSTGLGNQPAERKNEEMVGPPPASAPSTSASDSASAVAKRKNGEMAGPPSKRQKVIIHTDTVILETTEDSESTTSASGITRRKTKKSTKSTRSTTVSQTYAVLLH